MKNGNKITKLNEKDPRRLNLGLVKSGIKAGPTYEKPARIVFRPPPIDFSVEP